APAGTLRVLRPHKTTYPANWKFQAEQDTDGYHGTYVHDSAFKTFAHFGTLVDYQRSERKDQTRAVHGAGRTVGFPRGHCLLERPGTRASLPGPVLQEYMDQLTARYGRERAERITMVRHVFVFPSVYLMDEHVRVFRPVTVDRTVAYNHYTWFH